MRFFTGKIIARSFERTSFLRVPVESDAKHSVVSERGHEEVDVAAVVAERGQRSVVERDLTDPTPVAVAERLGRRVAAAEAGALGEDEFEFRRRAAGDERPDQGQRVLVEVGLERGRKF